MRRNALASWREQFGNSRIFPGPAALTSLPASPLSLSDGLPNLPLVGARSIINYFAITKSRCSFPLFSLPLFDICVKLVRVYIITLYIFFSLSFKFWAALFAPEINKLNQSINLSAPLAGISCKRRNFLNKKCAISNEYLWVHSTVIVFVQRETNFQLKSIWNSLIVHIKKGISVMYRHIIIEV